MTQCYKLAVIIDLISLVEIINKVQNCFSFLEGFTRLPERQNRADFASSFAIGRCAGTGKIANVLANALAKEFSLLTICVEWLSNCAR